MKNLKYSILLLFLAILILPSCGDDEPEVLSVTALTAVGTSFEDGADRTSDLNGSASAADVPLNATITATFIRPVDGTTATTSSVTLTSDAGDEPIAVSATGSTITINPTSDMKRGTLYTLSMTGIMAVDGGLLATTTRSFTTEGRAEVIAPKTANMLAYFNFDGNTNDATGSFNPDNVVAITFDDDRFGQGNSAATFDGNTSIIEILNGDRLMEANDFTLSFWVKTNTTNHLNENGDPANFFVMGLAAFKGFQFEIPQDFGSCKLAMSYETSDGTNVNEDLWFNGSGEDNTNTGWQGWDFVANLSGSGGVEALIKDKWAHIVCTYNAAEKQGRLYINGDLMKSQDFDLWPDGDLKRNVVGVTYDGVPAEFENILALGFIKSIDSPQWSTEPWGNYAVPTSNHFKGQLDDIRIFSAPYSAQDAKDLYDAEK